MKAKMKPQRPGDTAEEKKEIQIANLSAALLIENTPSFKESSFNELGNILKLLEIAGYDKAPTMKNIFTNPNDYFPKDFQFEAFKMPKIPDVPYTYEDMYKFVKKWYKGQWGPDAFNTTPRWEAARLRTQMNAINLPLDKELTFYAVPHEDMIYFHRVGKTDDAMLAHSPVASFKGMGAEKVLELYENWLYNVSESDRKKPDPLNKDALTQRSRTGLGGPPNPNP